MAGFVKVTFEPIGQVVYVSQRETVLAAAREGGIGIHTPCGGRGTCGSCRVIFTGDAPEPTPEEKKHLTKAEISSGMRLACRSVLERDTVINLPASTVRRDTKFLLHGITREAALRPSVRKVVIDVSEPSLDDQRADCDRVLAALEDFSGESLSCTYDALAAIPAALRAGNYRLTAVIDAGEVITVEPGDTSGVLYAAAFDIGTTTVVGMLIDLATGREEAVAARTNPQVAYGDDVVSRISFAGADEGLATLRGAIVGCANEILAELISTAGISRDAVYRVVLCGNTAMNHIFLGVDPTFIAQAPYVASVRSAVVMPGCTAPMDINGAGRVETLPNVAGFVGGDTVGMMLAADYAHSKKLRLAVDIGTNGEIVLGTAKRLLAASTAAGPAFEGARIRHGMRAAPGAIESVVLDCGRLVVETIDSEPAVGLCGTGLIDSVASLLEAGIIDETGRLLSPDEVSGASDDLLGRLERNDAGWHFVLADPEKDAAARRVVLSQRDVRELQLAKGAIAAGIRILLKEYGANIADLDEVLLAGAFGNYIKPASALKIGLLPDVPPERVRQIGNAAGTGARLVAVDAELAAEAEMLSLETRYVELAGRADFQMIFADAMIF